MEEKHTRLKILETRSLEAVADHRSQLQPNSSKNCCSRYNMFLIFLLANYPNYINWDEMMSDI
jgi:hypothetical protein